MPIFNHKDSKVLLLGASGRTGRYVLDRLIERKIKTRILIRNHTTLPARILENPDIDVIRGSIRSFDPIAMQDLVRDCRVIVSCLGHRITFKGIFGRPRDLVFGALKGFCAAINEQKSDSPVQIILMSTTACTNKRLCEKNRLIEKLIFSLLFVLLPPHRDNVRAANHLIKDIGKNDPRIEWVQIRPDTLIEGDHRTSYDVFASPTKSPIFHPGHTKRINVAHFMVELITNEDQWKTWSYKTPVLYDHEDVVM
jgi:nucleoside-diphosphate-sugar epimerase